MTREEELLRAKRVRLLLDSEDVQAAFADIEADMIGDYKRTHWDQVALRESIHAELRALDRIGTRLRTWADQLDT